MGGRVNRWGGGGKQNVHHNIFTDFHYFQQISNIFSNVTYFRAFLRNLTTFFIIYTIISIEFRFFEQI